MMTAAALESLFLSLRQAYLRQPNPPAGERRAHLRRLRQALLAAKDDLAQTIREDFGHRSEVEVLYSEIFVSVHSLRHAEDHLEDWMQPRPASLDWVLQPGVAYVRPQPVGVVGIMSAWNYPVFVSIAPLAGALAAGNRVLLKPSELTPRTSARLAALIRETFAPDHVAVVEGGPETGHAVASLPLDHLIFTGSTAVGRKILEAAAPNLTRVTLELGGKSPALVTESANLKRAAADIAYGKCLNAGQICIAPDYVLVPRALRDRLVEELSAAIAAMYPQAAGNDDYTSVINDRHYARLASYVEEARPLCARVVEPAGASDAAKRRFAPVLLVDPPAESRVMQEEIFGPVLPVVSYAELEEAIEFINARPRPLAMYLFTRSSRVREQVLDRTAAGGVCVNDTLVHIVAENLPFGGIGASGFGAYHGQAGFDTCSHLKPVFERHGRGAGAPLRPPYGRIHQWMKRLLIR